MINTAAVDGSRPAGSVRRTRGHGAGGGDFAKYVDGEPAAAPAGTAPLANVGALDVLIGIQEVGDEEGGRRRTARRYGDELLDRLDRLRRHLLAGVVPAAELTMLAHALRSQARRSGDAALDGVIADIELRVEVEIAKLRSRG